MNGYLLFDSICVIAITVLIKKVVLDLAKFVTASVQAR
jgi:hypothetical protein